MKEGQRAATESCCSRTLRVTLRSLCFSSGNLSNSLNRTAWSSVKDGPPGALGSRSELEVEGDWRGIAWAWPQCK